MGYKLAIFDFDGTLADSFDWFCRAVTTAAERFRFRAASETDVEQLRGLDAARIARHLQVPAWKIPFIARYMRRHMTRELQTIRLFPEMEDVLHRLAKSGLTLAIVTSNSKHNVQTVLGRELSGLIAHYGCGASIYGKRSKLRSILRKTRLAPEHAIYLGDELRDLHAARAERIAFGAVGWGYTLPHAFAAYEPHELFATPREIAARLIRQNEERG